jgi:hypothetical protein
VRDEPVENKPSPVQTIGKTRGGITALTQLESNLPEVQARWLGRAIFAAAASAFVLLIVVVFLALPPKHAVADVLFSIAMGTFILALMVAAMSYFPRLVLVFVAAGFFSPLLLVFLTYCFHHLSHAENSDVVRQTAQYLWPAAIMLAMSSTFTFALIISLFFNAVIYGMIGTLVYVIVRGARQLTKKYF